MGKVIPFINKYFFLAILISVVSCTISEEYQYLDEKSVVWRSEDDLNDHFTMVDNNGIAQVFEMKVNKDDPLRSGSFFLGFQSKTYREYIYQKYQSNFGTEFYISLQAGYEGESDDVYFECADIGFAYDPQKNALNRVNTYFGNLGQSRDTYGNYTFGLKSGVYFLPDMEINNRVYDRVIVFTLKDLADKWDDQTLVELYVAEKVGLVKYVLNNGVYYERQ
jgi:hypothetical protein